MPLPKQQSSYPLSMPDEMRVQLEERAKLTGRSVNAEIIAMLAVALYEPPPAHSTLSPHDALSRTLEMKQGYSMSWVKLEKYTELTGDSADAVNARRRMGKWLEGNQYKIVDGRVWVSLPAVQRWIERWGLSIAHIDGRLQT